MPSRAQDMTPAKTLSRRFNRLRHRFLARRALEILAIALAVDLAITAISLGSSLLFGRPLPIQFTLEALLAVLLAQAAMRSREVAFAHFLDRRFGLKDRLYSHLQYRKDLSVPLMLREAQAMECLRSLDFAQLARRVGPRFPPSLFLTLPLFAALTFFFMNASFRPPGPIGRTVVSLLAPQQVSMPSPGSSLASDGALPDASDAAASTVDAIAKTVPSAGTDPARATAPAAGGDAGDGKGVAGPERRGFADEKPAGGPEAIQSFPVTSQVSSVVVPVLADEASGPDALAFDPKRLLGLIPWPEAERVLFDLTQMARDVPTPSTEGYPVAYRSHIDRYFQELLAWKTL